VRVRSASELHEAFLTRGGFPNSTVWTASAFVELLNSSLAEVWRLLADSWEDYFLLEDTNTTLEVGREFYPMPADFWRLRLLEVSRSDVDADSDDQDFVQLRRVGLQKLNLYRKQTGDPRFYHLRGVYEDTDDETLMQPCIVVAPRPSVVRVVRITFVPAPPQFTVDDGTISDGNNETGWDTIAGYDKLLLEFCLYDAYKRAKMPVVECAQEIARLTQDLKANAPNRDAAEPETIAEHVDAYQRRDRCEDDH
jgi:hypothetical protein